MVDRAVVPMLLREMIDQATRELHDAQSSLGMYPPGDPDRWQDRDWIHHLEETVGATSRRIRELQKQLEEIESQE